MKLKNGQEIIGTVKDLEYNDKNIQIRFSLNKDIIIPKNKILIDETRRPIERG